MKKLIFFLLTLIVCNYCYGQNLILQKNRYNAYLTNSNDSYIYIGGRYIDPRKEGVVNFQSLEEGIIKVVKDENYSGVIVLNIENSTYQQLKLNSKYHEGYNRNISRLIQMVKIVKELRPKAEVTIYNIPFMYNHDSQKIRSDYAKLYPLLKELDVFSPSLYLQYSDMQRNDKYFNEFIKNNLDLSFEYAEKLNKRVYPFIWYKIHPSNKLYGGAVVTSTQYSSYLKLLKAYSYKTKKVEKLIYWEPAKETLDVNNKVLETLKFLK